MKGRVDGGRPRQVAAAPSPIPADAIVHVRHLRDTLRVVVPQSTADPLRRRTLNVTSPISKAISRQVREKKLGRKGL